MVLNAGHTYSRRRSESTHGRACLTVTEYPSMEKKMKEGGGVDNEMVECSVNGRLWESGKK